ncbi:phosphoglycerate mutase family protein [Hyphomonas neptunium ATCC 15444]|uniref:Alpha-ribazole phosphatase n=2 Tax=Hyphomonas TaxID=85 RepID=Q0C218_HYPNA|nr:MULTISPECIES: alpha-ribazole phosphatase [Hyphomonas]ABI76079.1 phosphoglycerate mutase family protein [Hyphomonas neptunium ATCC 15444]KCZ93060.1 phosphoglycerate mutase family protein [Hyphomonas hirschiana VP5]
MALILLRHTRPDVLTGTCYGARDVGLAATFAGEAEALLPGLPSFSRVVTSPLSRCRRLAEYIGARASCPLTEDDRLREMNFGSWEGRSWNEIPFTEIDIWVNDFLHARPHGGESVAMLRARTFEALDAYRKLGGDTLIVTHAGVIKAALATDETADSHAMTLDFGNFVTLID